MSVQYTDGSFSDTMSYSDALAEFLSAVDNGTARALYVGSEDEICHIKQKKKLEGQIAELSSLIKAIEDGPIRSENIIIPSRDEMLAVLRGVV